MGNDFYATPGPMTDLAEVADFFRGCPSDPAGVASVIHGLMTHPAWAAAYDVEPTDDQLDDVHIRSAAAITQKLLERSSAPATEAREPAERFIGNCRHHAVLTTAILRHNGVPARARCGFGGYFEPPRWVDHWVTEHWDGESWRMIDPQIDALQQEVTGLADPTDLSTDEFLTGGQAWQACQRGDIDGELFGIFDMWGQWFVGGNLGLDLASLNKVEMLTWDGWGDVTHPGARPSDDHLDRLAATAESGDLAAIRAAYAEDPATSTVFNIVREVEEQVPELA